MSAPRQSPAAQLDAHPVAPAPTGAPGGPRRSARIAALDAARALGVVAMVCGHTLDALLSPAARAHPFAVAYWKARGLTAPLFLLVAGWAVTVAIRRSGARGLAVPAGRLPRVLLLLAVAYALRWPGWGAHLLAAGDPETWAHLLGFDALHAIAVALLATAAVLALPWTAREQGLLLALLAVAAVTLGMRAPAPLVPAAAALPSSPLALALAQAVGGTSAFPVVPWGAYFFAGAIVALAAGDGAGRRAAALAAVGGALVLATGWTGVGTMPPGHPVLFLFRVGAVLLVLAALSRVPAGLAARVAPLGRASLGVYAIHVPIVYGWSTHEGLAQRVGASLPAVGALAAAALVLAASLALHLAVKAGRAALVAGARPVWARLGAAVAPLGVALRGPRDG